MLHKDSAKPLNLSASGPGLRPISDLHKAWTCYSVQHFIALLYVTAQFCVRQLTSEEHADQGTNLTYGMMQPRETLIIPLMSQYPLPQRQCDWLCPKLWHYLDWFALLL